MTLDQHTPVEPFGDAGDYDVSENYIVYTTKDPDLPEAWHTKQNVRIHIHPTSWISLLTEYYRCTL